MLIEKFVWGVGCVGCFATDEFVDHATHRIDIASRVEVASFDLLWRHVRASTFDFVFSPEEFS